MYVCEREISRERARVSEREQEGGERDPRASKEIQYSVEHMYATWPIKNTRMGYKYQ